MNKHRLREMSAVDYLDVFWRRKWLLTIPIMACLIFSVAACFLIKPEYKTFTLLLAEMVKPGAGTEAGRYEAGQQAGLYSEIDTISKLFFSKPFLQTLAIGLDLGLEEDNPVVTEERLQGLKESLSIEPYGARGILKISSYSVDPIFCARLANSATELFIKYYKQIGFERSSAEVEFLNEQKELYRKKLEESEEYLRKFKEENQEVLLTSANRKLAGALGQEITTGLSKPAIKFADYKDKLLDLKFSLEDAQRNKAGLEEQLAKLGGDPALESDDLLLQEMLKALADRSIELTKLKASGFTDEHPAIVRLKRQIEETEAAFKERVESLKKEGAQKKVPSPKHQQLTQELNKTESEMESLQNRITVIGKMAKEQEEFVKSIPEKEAMLERLQRDYDVNAKIYADLTSKLETASINQRLEQQEKGVRFKIVESASVPLYPYKPNKKFLVLLGVLVGAMAGMGLSAFAEAGDSSFATGEELEEAMNMPVLGNVDLIYTLKEAEAARLKHNLFIFSLGAVLITLFFAVVLRIFLR